jgi:hypothetical protein
MLANSDQPQHQPKWQLRRFLALQDCEELVIFLAAVCSIGQGGADKLVDCVPAPAVTRRHPGLQFLGEDGVLLVGEEIEPVTPKLALGPVLKPTPPRPTGRRCEQALDVFPVLMGAVQRLLSLAGVGHEIAMPWTSCERNCVETFRQTSLTKSSRSPTTAAATTRKRSEPMAKRPGSWTGSISPANAS